jgi:hypothetical protein
MSPAEDRAMWREKAAAHRIAGKWTAARSEASGAGAPPTSRCMPSAHGKAGRNDAEAG